MVGPGHPVPWIRPDREPSEGHGISPHWKLPGQLVHRGGHMLGARREAAAEEGAEVARPVLCRRVGTAPRTRRPPHGV